MNSVILDNWTFQDIGELIAGGYSNREVASLVVKEDAHTFSPILEGELHIEALVDMLTNIVLYDEFKLNNSYKYAWKRFENIVQPIIDAGLVTWTTPEKEGEHVQGGTGLIIKELCVTESLKKIQSDNEKSFDKTGSSKHVFESQIMWGGAGMLSRSGFYSSPYVGHPLRQRFIDSTNVFKPKIKRVANATRHVVELVKEQRASIYRLNTDTFDFSQTQIALPAIVVDVINAAERKEDLIPIAIEHRDNYKKLRKWLGKFRYALELENTSQLAKHQKELSLLVGEVHQLVGRKSNPGLSASISAAGLPAVSADIPGWWNKIKGRFTVRHDMIKMVKSNGHELAMKKLRKIVS